MITRAEPLPAPRLDTRTVRRRLTVVVPLFGLVTAAVLLLAPTLGSTPISLARVFDPIGAVGRQRRRADFLRGAAAARPRRGAGRNGAGGRGRRHAGAAAQSAGDPVHPRRVGGGGIGRDGRDRAPSRRDAARIGRGARRLLHRRHAGDRARLWPRHPHARRPVHQRAAAGGGHPQHAVLGADHVRAVPRGPCRLVPDRPLAAGQPRRQQLQPARRRRCRCWRSHSASSRCCRARSTC